MFFFQKNQFNVFLSFSILYYIISPILILYPFCIMWCSFSFYVVLQKKFRLSIRIWPANYFFFCPLLFWIPHFGSFCLYLDLSQSIFQTHPHFFFKSLLILECVIQFSFICEFPDFFLILISKLISLQFMNILCTNKIL